MQIWKLSKKIVIYKVNTVNSNQNRRLNDPKNYVLDQFDDEMSISKQDWSEKLRYMEMKDVLGIDINEDDQLSTFLEQNKQRRLSSGKKESSESQITKKQV